MEDNLNNFKHVHDNVSKNIIHTYKKEGNIVIYEGTKRAPNYEKGTFELQ